MVDIKNILYPTDFSEHSLVALPIALDLASRYGATLHCLHVFYFEDEYFLEIRYFAPSHIEEEEYFGSAKERLDNFVDAHVLLRDISINRTVMQGKPFVEIIRHCRQEKIDLIVLGTHGHSALASILLGSVAEKVVRKAPCAVLTVRHPEHRFEAP